MDPNGLMRIQYDLEHPRRELTGERMTLAVFVVDTMDKTTMRDLQSLLGSGGIASEVDLLRVREDRGHHAYLMAAVAVRGAD